MTLGKKILTGYGMAVLILGLVVIWALAHIITISRTSEAIIQENHKSILAAENMIEALERQESAVLMALLGSMARGVRQFRENEAIFIKWLTRAKDNVYLDGEAQLLQAIENQYTQHVHNFSKFIELSRNSGQPFQGKKKIYQRSITPLSAQIRKKCVTLSKMNEDMLYANNLKTSRMADRAVFSTSAVAAAGLLGVLVFSLILYRQITGPLRRLVLAAKKIGEGNYDVSLPLKSRDELGELAVEFNQMAARLEEYNRLNIDRIIAEKQKGEAILENIADGLIILDTELRITDINARACAIVKQKPEKCLSRPCTEILMTEGLEQRLRKMLRTGKTPEANQDDGIITTEMDGREKYFSCSLSPITNDKHNVTGIILMLRDVTSFKEVERLKNEFVMAASHELRTPLSSLGMSLALLVANASARLDERERVLLEGAHDELRRLKEMVNDLLDLSRIESGQIEMQLVPVSLYSPVEHVRAVFQGHLENKKIAFDMELPADLPAVRADADKLAWVLTNLVSNALQYVADNQGRIGIHARPAGDFLHVSVSDNGPGIPEAYQTKIFQKFTQVEEQDSGGAGLGLAMCREIIRAHGGTIWVDSAEGAGSTFTFTLPLAR